MKQVFCVIWVCFFMLVAVAQEPPPAPPADKSPMDMSYFPDQYPILKFQGKVSTPPSARVIYGRPQVDGRKIFGELIRYNEVWRMGANEATELELYRNARIGGKVIPKGRYTLYCIPTATEWTFILNKDTDSWGAFRYDSKKDVVRVKVKTKTAENITETLSVYFTGAGNAVELNVAWDHNWASLPISFL
jgi:hypothetical protein